MGLIQIACKFWTHSAAGASAIFAPLRLLVPLLNEKIFFNLLHLDLTAHPPGAPTATIHLSAEPVRPRAAQNGLFLPPSPEPKNSSSRWRELPALLEKTKLALCR